MEYTDRTNELINGITRMISEIGAKSIRKSVKRAIEDVYSGTGIRMSVEFSKIEYAIVFNTDDLERLDERYRTKVPEIYIEAFKEE